jgi:hypothetical protein
VGYGDRKSVSLPNGGFEMEAFSTDDLVMFFSVSLLIFAASDSVIARSFRPVSLINMGLPASLLSFWSKQYSILPSMPS